ncbi:MMPL family transporter [Thermoflavimicrobium daqui]|uniref:Transporter n=1 Tax=Thermoflavimicrobium daqui TaxID=2137476 RepID=A0A364K8X4_9BACL|nr:MMPL family transporter [Thermoflavimicrobium daqui]RAL26747.1 transporter [Thermoflavimicrobium daqui]
MSTFLYRVGKSAYDKPWYFIISWIAILGIVFTTLGVNGIHIGSEMKIEGTEAQKVLDQLAKELPEASGGQASVLFKAPKGERLDTPERLNAISKAIHEVYSLDYVINPVKLASKTGAPSQENPQSPKTNQVAPAEMPPYGPLIINNQPVPGVMISSNGNVALFQFQFTVQQMSLPESVTDSVIKAIKTVEDADIIALPSDTLKKPEVPIGGTAEIIGIRVAAVVLLLTLGSVVAAGLPLLTAILGVAISVGGAFAISNFINITDITPVLALMIGLAVGIDYSLFIVNRQRRMILDQGLSARAAASRAIGTAGSAVFFAGLTVIIALCGLLVIGIEFLSTMAIIAAVSVLVNVLITLTLLPALLGLIGERICSPKARRKKNIHKTEAHQGIAHSWVKGVVKYRWPIIIGVIAILGIAAIPVTKMEMAIPSGATANLDTPARQSYDAISEGFGEGFNGPLLLVTEPKGSSSKVTPAMLNMLVQDLQKHENVSLVTPMGINKNGDMAIISLIPKSGPNDKETKNLVEDLRDSDSSIAKTHHVKMGVTGFTAINIDMSSKLAEVFPLYIGIIVILSLIILLLVFRSLMVPIKATVGFLLSVLATFGITTTVFQWGYLHSLLGFDTGGPLLSFMPILVTGILYGLAMDYQVFLVSSMRESYIHGHRGNESVIHGYQLASRVVLAAAVIMVSVFAGFIFTDDIMIKQIGFALALGILIDTFIVRMTLVPAVMAIFGDKAWWLPKWLDRILPNLDVEGDKLIAQLKAKESTDNMPHAR